MSSIGAKFGHSEACCSVPAVVATGYKAQGTYETIGGYKTYTTGPADATKGIVFVYDIFGYKDQSLQGADILGTSDKAQAYKVAIPDWFGGSPMPLELFPPDTPEKQEALGAFLGKNRPAATAEKLPAYVEALRAQYPAVTSWAAIGFCWGGKVVTLAASAGATTPFGAVASIHPAMVDPKDAPPITVPITLLASGDEPPADVTAFEKALTVPHHVETFADQIHGWMAARADLSDPRVKAEYKRGYETVLAFFGKHLK